MSASILATNKDAALAMASLGLHVFPCVNDPKDERHKKPKVTAWEQTASVSPFDIAVKWDASPDSLPGLPIGAHGLVVIDADRKAGGPDGVAAFVALCAEQGIDLSGAFVVETPSTGLHFYFSTTTPYSNSSGSLPKGIDVRGKGGYVIGPGARLPDGRSYRIVGGSWDAIPPLPDALAAFLREKRPATLSALPDGATALPVTDRERSYAEAALADDIAKLSAMAEGEGRNKALNDASHSLGTMVGWIDLNAGADRLLAASVANGYVAKDGQAAAFKTIMSGIEAGRLKPRSLLSAGEPKAIELDPAFVKGIAEYKRTHSTPLAHSKPAKKWPAPLSDDAYIGIAGEFIRLVAPQTEGDPCALLIAFLTVVGSFVGRGAYLSVGATEHYANLFSVVVAETSKGRKGTVMNEAQRFAKMIDPTVINRMKNGLSSGEGLIEHIRDPIEADIPIKEGGKVTGHQRQVVDIGIADKRLIVTEDEMGQALTVASREGNTLSATLRLAWDSKILATMARNNKNVCKEPYVSILGNITLDELKRLLTATDSNNGFGNRFLWVCAKRSRLLPFGGDVDKTALQELANKAAHVINASTHYGKCGWQSDAASMWAKEYTLLSSGRGGLAGAMSARAEAQTLRLALIYAILDGCNNVDVHHLRAALEVWRYCQDSVDYCFETSSGNTVADRILTMLASMPNGASRSQVSRLFNGNKSKDELQLALDTLKSSNKARSESSKEGEKGRPTETWFAC